MNFVGIAVSGRILNGIWIDFIVVQIMFLIANNFYFWMVSSPVKIVDSPLTDQLLKQYRLLKNNQKMSNKQQKAILISEFKSDRSIKFVLKAMYMDWNLFLIVFFILASIAGNSIIAFGYFLFGMVLIHLSRDYFQHAAARVKQMFILKYLLLPYLLFDIGTQLCFNIPGFDTLELKDVKRYIGVHRAWTYNPKTVYLGEVITVEDILSDEIIMLMFRGILYLLIAIQLNLVQSRQFLKFYDGMLFSNAS